MVKHVYIEWTASAVFAAVALTHLLRLANGWDFVVGSFSVPMWISGIAVLLGAYLSMKLCPLRKTKRK